MEKHTWLVSCCGSLWDNAVTERVIGTKEEVRKYLLDLVTKEREEKEKDDGDETWDYGAETLDDVYEVNDPPPSHTLRGGGFVPLTRTQGIHMPAAPFDWGYVYALG